MEDFGGRVIGLPIEVLTLTNALVGATSKQGFDTWYMLVVDFALGQFLETEAKLAIARTGGRLLGACVTLMAIPISAPICCRHRLPVPRCGD